MDVVMLQCDQLCARVLALYGGPVATPHLERLAAGGVVFDNATCTTPICSPARASILTGRHTHEHGIAYNVDGVDARLPGRPRGDGEGIHADEPTTDLLLHRAGWRTHHVGKLHLLDDELPYWGGVAGMYLDQLHFCDEMRAPFDRVRQQPDGTWMPWLNWALPVTQTPAFQRAVAGVGTAWDDVGYRKFITGIGRLDQPVEDMFDWRVRQRAIERIRSTPRGERLALTASFVAPHDPNVLPEPWYSLYDPERIALPHQDCPARYANDWARRMVVGWASRACVNSCASITVRCA